MHNTGRASRRTVIGATGAIFWMALILGLYYWVHKPITPALARAVGGAALDLALAALVVTLAGGLGRRLLARLDLSPWSVAERATATVFVGLGALSLLILAVGAVALTAWSMIALLVLVAAVAWRDTFAWLRDLIGWARGGLPARGWARFLAGAVVILLIMALIMAVLPPTKWDVLTYHLAGPEQYVDHGRFYAVPHNHFLGFPPLVETLYSAQLAITGRLTGGGPLHWLIGALMLLATGGYTARHAGRTAGWIAVGAILVARTIWLEMTFAYVDLMLMGLTIVGLAVIDLWDAARRSVGTYGHTPPASPPQRAQPAAPSMGFDHQVGIRRWFTSPPFRRWMRLNTPSPSNGEGEKTSAARLGGEANTSPIQSPGLNGKSHQAPQTGVLILLGAILGLAGGTKYTAVWIGVAFGALIAWLSRRDGVRTLIRRGLVIGGVAAVLVAPWLIRNLVLYDNPLYPFVFEGGGMDSIRQEWYHQPESGMIYAADKAWQIPIMPLIGTIFGVENAGIYASDVGPLFAILVPLLPLVWAHLTEDERSVIWRALIVSGVMTLCWIVSASFGSYINIQTRLVLYIFPPLAVVAAITLEALRRLPDKPVDVGFIVRAMVALVIVFTLIDGTRTFVRSGIHEYFSGKSDYRERFLDYTLGWHHQMIQEVNDLPAGSVVRFLWEPRYLYCDDDRITCRPDSLMDSWYYARRTVGDGSPAAIAAHWHADGNPDFLLVNEIGRDLEENDNDLYDKADWEAWRAFVADYLVEIWRGPDEDGDGDEEDDVVYILYTWQRPGG